jgi:hypothetical protein
VPSSQPALTFPSEWPQKREARLLDAANKAVALASCLLSCGDGLEALGMLAEAVACCCAAAPIGRAAMALAAHKYVEYRLRLMHADAPGQKPQPVKARGRCVPRGPLLTWTMSVHPQSFAACAKSMR